MSGVDSKPPPEPLSEKRRQLLGQYLRRGVSAPTAPTAPVPPPSPAQPLPLSFAQASLWLLDRLDASSTQYHVPDALRLRGELNRETLVTALNAVIARHDSLRAHFIEIAGEPVQHIDSALRIELPLVDLSSLPAQTQATTLSPLLDQEIARPFDLSTGPLVRAKLFQLGPHEHVLLTVCHHIVCDGWSIGVFNRELAALYSASSLGKPGPLSPLPMQYGDYVRRQRQRLQGTELDRLLTYWVKQLTGAPPLVTLPTDRPRPTRTGAHAAYHTLELSPQLSDSLRAFSKREGVTLFITLLAAFKVVLARHSGQTDLVIGAPIAGRDQAAMEGLIGYFINALALRTDLSGNPSFRELLQRVRTTALDAFSHQDLPFEKLVEKLQPERDRSHAPVFQILFNFFNLDAVPESFGGLKVERVPVHEPGAKFDLTLFASDAAERIQLRALYNADLFTAPAIERLLARYQTLLEAITLDPGQPIGRLPLLTPADRRRYSVADHPVRPRNPFVPFQLEDTEQSIPARFEQMVRLAPNRLAVKTRTHTWTYGELSRRSQLIAQKLLQVCRGGPTRVALLLDHDAPMIAALLGVLRAGKVYVPLDPTHPQDRLAGIIADAQAEVIVTDAKNAARVHTLNPGRVPPINLNAIDWQAPAGPPLPPVPADALAYLLFTSGSTGKPKAVTQVHRQVLQHIRNYTNSLHICAADRLTLFASYGFDAAVMGIYGALLNGATLYPFNVGAENLDRLGDWLVTEELTIYHSTPTLYRYLIGTLSGRQQFPRLRLIVMGGEKVVPLDVAMFQKYFSADCLFVNGYGPTECTIALQCFLDAHTPLTGGAIPIGYPVTDPVTPASHSASPVETRVRASANTLEVSLINSAGDPGQVFGEIVIRSPALAVGYWRRPELTAAAFPGDPQSPLGRTYRTGDLGRLLPNGMIESMGRQDFQVKIRGFRIELGEVESVLRATPGVDDCVVIAEETKSGDPRLLAYVVAARGHTPDASAIRESLKHRLPDYMIPARLIFLPALPLTPNGKIDRKALPAPPAEATAGADHYVAPRNAIERQLARIWQDVLGGVRAGIHDDFFALGGHSLLGVRVLSLIERQLGRKLPLATIFEARTLEQLAARLQPEAAATSWRSLVPIQPTGTRPPLFGIHFLRYQNLIPHLGPEQPVYGLRYGLAAQTGNDELTLPDTLEQLAAHYLAEMRRFQPRGPYALLGYSFGGVVAFEMARQLHAAGEEVRLLALLDSRLVIAPKLLPLAEVTRNVIKGGVQGVVRRAVAIAKREVHHHAPPGYRPHEHLSVHDARLRRTYVPQPYAGGITLFKAGETQDFYRTNGPAEDSWRGHVRGPINVHQVTGSHLGILEEPHVRLVAEILTDLLNRPVE